jgi:hypothetical protein
MPAHAFDSLSDRLHAAAQGLRTERVALREIAAAHGDSAQGTMLVMLSVPTMLPIPGVGTVLGMGLLALALTLWSTHGHVTLPARVAAFDMPCSRARRLLHQLSRVYAVAGRHARERWSFLATQQAHRLWQIPTVLLMALIIILPLPLGNVLPAIALALLGVGLAFRDGMAVLASAVMAGLAVAYVTALAFGAVELGLWLA